MEINKRLNLEFYFNTTILLIVSYLKYLKFRFNKEDEIERSELPLKKIKSHYLLI